MKGSLILVGGDPGIGKSTLLLQLVKSIDRAAKLFYVSGEESEKQLKMRADRLGIDSPEMMVLSETDISSILHFVNEIEPDILIIDSSYKIDPFTPDTNTDKDQRLLVNGETAQWCVDHKIKCVGFGDGVSIENCNEDVKPFHDICMAENIVFLEVLKNLDKLTQDTFFMSYSPLPIYGLDSCPIRAYAIEGLAEFSR